VANPIPFDPDPLLTGSHLRVRPIRSDEFEALYAVASDPLVWAQHPAKNRSERAVFENWFKSALAQHALVVEELATGRVIGSSRYYHWDADAREVSIGYTFIARDQWGGAANAQLKELMLAHAFKWAQIVWFHVDPANMRSQKALQKIGATRSHTAPIVINGEAPREYVFFRIDAPAAHARP
jgi:RimJ/RimL family protein N-acetyltransferase